MAIPRIIHPINPQDYTKVPFKVHKRFSLSNENVTSTSSGYVIWKAVHSNLPTPIYTQKASNDPTNSFDGSYQHVIWKYVDAQYYRFPYQSPNTLEHSNSRFSYKFLNYSASILSIPYMDCGESIKPGSISYSQSGFTLKDDGNGNLYDSSISSASFAPRQNLIGYWGFNDEFKRFKYRDGSVDYSKIKYQSHIFDSSYGSFVKNVTFEQGVTINSTGSGMCIEFTGSNSYALTPHRDEFNFNGDFSISFWINRQMMGQSQPLISKKLIVEKLDNELSRSFIEETTPVYPFHIEYYSVQDGITFFRSNGIDTVQLQIEDFGLSNTWQHCAVVKTGSQLISYANGSVFSSATDISSLCYNKHSVTFGKGFDGKLDEVRFYNCGLTPSQIQSLSTSTNQTLYQTGICGNAFYRRGNIVISGFDSKYHNAFQNQWSLNYRGTHTIYQHEVLIRIGKGQFNLSQNPTALKDPNSDLLIDDFVTGSLFPYVTTIGFYDEDKDLVAIGKLNYPLAMRDDVVINIIARFDT